MPTRRGLRADRTGESRDATARARRGAVAACPALATARRRPAGGTGLSVAAPLPGVGCFDCTRDAGFAVGEMHSDASYVSAIAPCLDPDQAGTAASPIFETRALMRLCSPAHARRASVARPGPRDPPGLTLLKAWPARGSASFSDGPARNPAGRRRRSRSTRLSIRKYDGFGPRYTSYPTADRFTDAFGADQLIERAARSFAAAAAVAVCPHPLLQHDLLLLRVQQGRHQGSWPVGRVHPLSREGSRDRCPRSWTARRR